MFSENQLLPISALQHLLFCERQCALIHIEGLWAENRFTVEGQHAHRKAHDGPNETRDGVTTARGLPLRSFRLGLVGVADVVEFRQSPRPGDPAIPFPVEYKRGRPKSHDADRVQLCAQALCLEEMLGVPVPEGALYYGKTRRRKRVTIDRSLRALTEQACERLHALIAGGKTPSAVREPKCARCSLYDLCLPQSMGVRRSVNAYLARAFAASLATTPSETSAS
ncbi:MAG: CRISPR-associated protein Cas4 [Gemmatimonadaceae bacterium]